MDWLWSLISQLLGAIELISQENLRLTEDNRHLRDEIAVIKGEKAKPKFKPSGMEEETEPKPAKEDTAVIDGEKPSKRPGSAKRSKTQELVIHQEVKVAPTQPVPEGSRFKGYSGFVIQDIIITPNNTRYLLEVWQTPEGDILHGEIPSHLNCGHFGHTLRAYILDQHHGCQVTQRLLHEQLERWGVQISVGQIDALLSEHNESFFDEADQILVTGLEVSSSITVDDSGARHQGKNGYVTQIGNEWFAWFSSTYSKSRINFLELLQAGTRCYSLNEHAIDYMREQGLPNGPLQNLQEFTPNGLGLADSKQWNQYLDILDITAERHRKIATEGALLGGLIDAGFSLDLVIVSDGAGQFTILLHALCWVHAERLVHKLIPLCDRHREDQQRVRGEIWDLYADLKAYKSNPDPTKTLLLEARFDAIFTQRTSFETLNQTLRRLHKRKDELLLVLKRPDIPLHTNGSESDIRSYVKRRKVSGGTRSDIGKQCRDAFASLNKTCRKLGVSFWEYLIDRIEQRGEIASLPDIIRQRVAAAVP